MAGIRWFFFGTLLLSVILIGAGAMLSPLAADSTEFPAEGLAVWRAHGCESCHTIYGQGGAFAPDLTRIYAQRGENYLRDFLINPQAYHPAQRIMPAFGLTRTETDSLMAYLRWVGEQPAAVNFPVHTINVSGGGDLSSLGLAAVSAAREEGVPTDPIEAGNYWFHHAPVPCSTCHSLEPNAVIVGPSLAGVAARAETRIAGMSAEAYLHQSILDPGAFVVPGFPDAMARNLGDTLTSDQINQIIAFLLTLR